MKSTENTSTATRSALKEEKEGEYKLQFMVLEQKREIRDLKRSVDDSQKEIERYKVSKSRCCATYRVETIVSI